ncbi:uncharacterized protein LOC143588129 [Bidens hawaiensis]|uniref:uncharacterized protein LOC143588129 n=1 Tax=Bidens hawaiensis TaxID=980011 RepID=UPI0040495D23
MAKNRQLTAKFIAKDLLPLFKAKPLWSGREIQDAVKEKYKVLICKWLANNAKNCAFKMLHGSMREHYRGMLLVAIRRDANEQMYPVAWAVVDGEFNDSWEWFMEELRKCLDAQDGGKDWTFVSDQQKGLVNAVSLIWKNAEHRNGARHIYANWNKKFKGKELKMYYWQEMRAISADAVEAFMKQNPNCFVRCILKGHTSCEVIVNNMAETFNGTIVEVKDFADDLAVDLITEHVNVESIPCKHVCVVAGFLGRNAEEFVHDCYLKEAYLRSYSYTIPPLPSERYWPKVDYPSDPPPIKIQSGGLKTKRKNDPHENPKKSDRLCAH